MDEAADSRILLIDDDPAQVAGLREPLVAAGYAVETARDGGEGLALTRAWAPDLVVCDWMMPQVDGIDYCRTVKNDPERRQTWIAILTARADASAAIEALDAGADDFLAKPVDLGTLLARLRAGTRMRELRRQLVEAQRRETAVEMAVTLGHEINNPLTGLFGHLELMRRCLAMDDLERLQHHVERSRDVAERIAAVARGLIELRDPKMKPYLGDQQMVDLELERPGA